MSETATGAPGQHRPSVAQRVWVVTLVVGVALAVLWPVLRQPPRDSFPLSTYPMFSFPRDPVVDIDLVFGVTSRGSDVRLGPELIAATDEVIQAGALVRRAVAGGDETADRLCRTVADRLARSGPDVDRVEVRTERYDAVAWFRGDREPGGSTLRAACPVTR